MRLLVIHVANLTQEENESILETLFRTSSQNINSIFIRWTNSVNPLIVKESADLENRTNPCITKNEKETKQQQQFKCNKGFVDHLKVF